MRTEVLRRYDPIMTALERAGGKPLYVGGVVRDLVIEEVHGYPADISDIDIEVFGLNLERVGNALREVGNPHLVGNSFPVWQVTLSDGEVVDVALPRRESKSGLGHIDFETLVDPFMSFEEASARRDFTMNAMGMYRDGTLLDDHGGTYSIEDREIRHVGEAFSDDPLRVLRGMQFASRFDFYLSPGTRALANELMPQVYLGPKRPNDPRNYLPYERVWKEWKKALFGRKPELALNELYSTGWIALWPELLAMCFTEQDPDWHPEGNVFVHTFHALSHATKVADREHLTGNDRLTYLLAVISHDIGKCQTTYTGEDGHIHSPGHAQQGANMVPAFLTSIGALPEIIDRVVPLVREHMSHIDLKKNNGVNPAAIRRLARRLEPATMQELVWLSEADASGRPPTEPQNPAQFLLDSAIELNVDKRGIQPIVMGRHLLAENLVGPGPGMGVVLSRLFEAQEEGVFSTLEEGLQLARRIVNE